MDEVVVISPEIRPGEGGLADYTLRVLEEWGDRARVRLVVPAKQSFAEELPRDRGNILLQYSAYGFDPLGYPRWLLHSLGDWKRSTTGSLLVVMFHEIWTFWPLLNKNRLVQSLHRRDIRKLISVADAVFTSTPSQAEHLRELAPTCAMQVLPVGANIRRTAPMDGQREEGVAVLFGLAGVRVRALRTMHADMKSLAAQNLLTRLISIGNGSAPEEEQLLGDLRLAGGFEQRGALPEAEVSQILARATFGISAQDELSLMKSGTFMAYAAHALNILSPYADSLGPEPLCWLTHPRELREGISHNELNSRAESLRQWQERTSSWSEIAARFAEALQLA